MSLLEEGKDMSRKIIWYVMLFNVLDAFKTLYPIFYSSLIQITFNFNVCAL